jgi:O-antigen/teichoic acid export membrane protein
MSQQAKKAINVLLVYYFISQGIRLGVNLIVSRLVAPDVFGIMAVVITILIGLAMFSDVGLEAYVMRSKDYKDKKVLDTVWSIQVIRGLILSAIVIVGAILLWQLQLEQIIDEYGILNNPLLPQILIIVAIQPLFDGIKPLAPIVYARELKREKIELVELISQLLGASFIIVWAWYAPSVWALVYGTVFSAIVKVTLTYVLFDLRHRFTWNKQIVNNVFHFGKWILLSTILTYLSMYIDRIYLGMNITEEEFGFYAIASLLTGFFITLIAKSSEQVLLPFFSDKREQSHLSLRTTYYRVRLRQDLLVGGATVATILVADKLVALLYDIRYADVALFLKLIILTAIPFSVRQASKNLLISLGDTKVQLQTTAVDTLALVIFLPLLYEIYAIPGVVYALIISSFLALIPQIVAMRKQNMFLLWAELRVIPWVVMLCLFLQ